MKVYIVAVDDHDELESAGAALWDHCFTSLERCKLAVTEDALDYRLAELDSADNEKADDLEFENSGIRDNAWELEDQLTGRTWYIQEAGVK